MTLNRNRGMMGGCSHTNNHFYGENGCHECDREYAAWKAKQEKEQNKIAEVAGNGYTITVHTSPQCAPETIVALGEMVGHLIKQIEEGKFPKQ